MQASGVVRRTLNQLIDPDLEFQLCTMRDSKHRLQSPRQVCVRVWSKWHMNAQSAEPFNRFTHQKSVFPAHDSSTMSHSNAHDAIFDTALRSLEKEGVDIGRLKAVQYGEASSPDGRSFTAVFPKLESKFEGSADATIMAPTLDAVPARLSYSDTRQLTDFRKFKVSGYGSNVTLVVLENGPIIAIWNGYTGGPSQGSGNWSALN